MNFFRSLQKYPEVQGFALLFIVLSQVLSLVTFDASTPSSNFLGLFGHGSALFWFVFFGFSSFAFLAGMTWLGIGLVSQREQEIPRQKWLTLLLVTASLALLLALAESLFPKVGLFFHRLFHFPPSGFPQLHLGGMPGHLLFSYILSTFFNGTGTFFFAFTALVISLAYFFDFSWRDLFRKKKDAPPLPKPRQKSRDTTFAPPVDLHYDIEQAQPITEIIQKKIPKELGLIPSSFHDYPAPPLDLLNPPKKHDQNARASELKQKASLLEETLLSFGIEAKVGQVHCGPTIASFEVHPAVGVKIGKIKTLENDIALNLEAKSIRIIAPIPGKAAVGIEIPHSCPQEVSFKELLMSYLQQGASLRIPMLLGKAVNGDFIISDLAKMPHCIIAGATGSGKSVCLNSIVMSILMTAKPDQVRLLMIDPKKVELTPYSELPHMLAPVITEPHAACSALQWLVKEMEKRYEVLKITGQRNIEGFNRRTINEEQEKASPIPIPKTFAYYVAIVDELADLMMVASQDIETPIARIAQMARAVGIHLILATQRPSREVITGLIRANFPARISFKVASRVNSQIILDETGAESLLGNGDMLFLIPGGSQLIRAQGVFIRDEEINRVIEHLTKQAPPQYLITSFESVGSFSQNGGQDGFGEESSDDDFYGEAKSIVLSTGSASTTFLQRKLKIGYARAASLMDMLENRGIVGPQDGSKPRKVFFGKKEEEEEDYEEED